MLNTRCHTLSLHTEGEASTQVLGNWGESDEGGRWEEGGGRACARFEPTARISPDDFTNCCAASHGCPALS